MGCGIELKLSWFSRPEPHVWTVWCLRVSCIESVALVQSCILTRLSESSVVIDTRRQYAKYDMHENASNNSRRTMLQCVCFWPILIHWPPLRHSASCNKNQQEKQRRKWKWTQHYEYDEALLLIWDIHWPMRSALFLHMTFATDAHLCRMYILCQW